MYKQLLRELEDLEIPLLTKCQLKFLDDVNSVIEDKILSDYPANLPDDEDEIFDIMCQVSAMQENLKVIVDRLKGGRSARKRFIATYPKWKKVREDGIEKLKEIADSINNDRFNCNVSKLVGYCTSFVGAGVTLTSAILIPFTLGLTTPLAIAGGSITAAGCSTAIGTSITEVVLLKSKVSKAQEIIEEDKKHHEEMSDWLNHAAELEKALAEILSIDIVKDITESVKNFVERALKIPNDFKRLNYIEKTLNQIIHHLPKKLQEAVPIIAVVTLVSILVTIYLLLLNTENRLVFDCAALTIRSIVGFASLLDDSLDMVRLTSLFTGNAVLAKDLARAVTRGAVAVIGMALDVAGIALTSIDIHKGSLSLEAEKIAKASKELKEEAQTMEMVYNNLS